MELPREPSQPTMDSHWSPLELKIWNEYNKIPIRVEDLTYMLVESIGVGDFVELVEFIPTLKKSKKFKV